jgi:Ca-activated chloride channel family protein
VGETNIENILKDTSKENDAEARLFVFGVGYDVNTKLLDSLAQDNRGSSDYVEPKEDIEEKVGGLYRKIAYPVLANPSLEWRGAQVYDVYPPRLPDLFRGTQAIVFGRIRGGGTPSVALTGSAGGREERVVGEVATTGDTGDTVPRLWAMRKVGYLIDDARRNNRSVPDEVRDEIIKLSKKDGIVTPFTASLITEDSPVTPPVPMDRPLGGPSFGGGVMPRGAGGGGFAMPGLAPAAGADAVAASKAARQLRETETGPAANTDVMRTIEGKTFVLRNQVWTDTAYTPGVSAAPKIVKFASPEYFTLARDSRTARWLSVGDRVIVVLGNQTIQIEP